MYLRVKGRGRCGTTLEWTIFVLGLVHIPASFSFSTLLQVCTIDTGPRSSAVGRVFLDVDGAS